MDLKFSFGGASPDHHDHGDAPSGIPLPFTTQPAGSASSVLEVRTRLGGTVDETTVIAEACSGDGVAYSTAEVIVSGEGSAALSRALRSAVSRAVAGLEGPLAESISALVVDLGGAESDALAELGVHMSQPSPVITESLQRRMGIAADTPIRFGD